MHHDVKRILAVKIRQLRLFIFCLAMFLSANVQAAAIGMPLPNAKLGFAVGVANLSVNDPTADSENEWVVRPINLIYTDELISLNRYWLEAFYQDAVLSASQDRIGQHVKQIGLRASLQKHIGTARVGESWLGAGLQVSHDRFEKRHTVDSAGYLAQTYPDRSGVQTGLLLNYVLEKNIGSWDVAGKFEKNIPISDGVSEFTLSVVFLFTY